MTLTRIAYALATFVVACSPAAAHGPTPQKVEEKVALTAAPDAVWAVLKEFGAICSWHAGLEKCEATGGSAPGASRTLTLKANGKALVEGLDEYNEAEKMYGYRLSTENVEALPVSFYSATLKVVAAGSGSEVEWQGRFYRADTSNFPPENLNDEAAVKAMTAFFQEGLQGLKAKLGEK
jgi:mxaD protein